MTARPVRDDGRVLVEVALLPESIEELLTKGDFVSRVWLEREDDGTLVLMGAGPDGDATAEALLRIAYGPGFDAGVAPPPPEATAEVEERIVQIKASCGWEDESGATP